MALNLHILSISGNRRIYLPQKHITYHEKLYVLLYFSGQRDVCGQKRECALIPIRRLVTRNLLEFYQEGVPPQDCVVLHIFVEKIEVANVIIFDA